MSRRPRVRESGFTLIELLISLTLLSIVMIGVFHATDRGLDLFQQSSASGDVSSRAARAASRISRELLGADSGTFAPALTPPVVGVNTGNSGVSFRNAIDYQAGAVVTGDLTAVQWEIAPGELANDADDDGDGIVDEGSVVLIRDAGGASERRIVLANGVRELFEGEVANNADDNGNGLVDEPGFCLDRDGDVLTIRLSLERTGPSGAPIVRSHEIAITVRN